jgi:deazaflavin-dependent oxidoreductase (nitroreductase family)
MAARRGAPETDWEELDKQRNVYLTTIGRKTGKPRRITAWFACDGGKVYLAGGRKIPQWCRNLRKNPSVDVEIGDVKFKGKARILQGKKGLDQVRALMFRKYFLARVMSWFGGYRSAVPVEITPDI